MKPTVPETGTVIRLEGENAVIMMKGGKSCKGCGMGGDISIKKLKELNSTHVMVAKKIISDEALAKVLNWSFLPSYSRSQK